jgi:hypothetical protein
MIESRRGPRLALESFAVLRSGGGLGRQDLNGNRAIEPGITRAIHFAHAAGAQRSRYFIGSETRAGRKGNSTGIVTRSQPLRDAQTVTASTADDHIAP